MIPRVNILGIRISAVNMRQALELISGWVARREPQYVCATAAHVIMDCRKSPALRGVINNSGMTAPDGMSLVWLLRFHGYRDAGRVYGADLMLEICGVSEKKNWRHFFYGGAPGVAEELTNRLKTKFPNLQIAGTYAPPFRPLTEAEDHALIERIKASHADILWVGNQFAQTGCVDGGTRWKNKCPGAHRRRRSI